MSKAAKRVTEDAPATIAPETVMTVLKPEAEQAETTTQTDKEEPNAPEPLKPVLSVTDIKRKAQELHHLSEQHDNLLEQLNKVQTFAAEVGENATLRLTSDGQHSFSSKDPAAVQAMVNICISNINSRIADVESRLIA